jgi:serine O-acetyltransferase
MTREPSKTASSSVSSLIIADLYRYEGAAGWKGFLRTFTSEPGFRLTTLLRLSHHLRSKAWGRWGLYHLVELWRRRAAIKFGVYIDPATSIGAGLYLGHPLGIVINRRCVIGADCSISQHVTLGSKNREPNKGCPTLGDRVYLGPGAVVIGAIQLGDDVAVGANAVVTKDAPAMAVVVGVPGRIVSSRGSSDYCTWCSQK